MTVICPECNGLGEVVYNIVTGRDENKITVEKRKDICRTCNGSGEKKMTNADRIREMSDEELATFMNCDGCPPKNEGCNDGQKCSLCWLEWLQQPAEDDGHA